MALEDSKKNNSHILASLLLMACIVLFVGSLYYLVIKGPWMIDSSYNVETVSIPKKVVASLDEPNSLGEALNILFEKDCTIVSFEINNKYEINEVGFQIFLEKAVKNHVVIVSTLNEEAILSVIDNGKLWVWHP